MAHKAKKGSQAFGGPRAKLRRQMESQGVPKAKADKALEETFGKEPKGSFYDRMFKLRKEAKAPKPKKPKKTTENPYATDI